MLTLNQVYAEKVHDLSVKVATEAAKQKVDKFIEVSTAQVYEAGKKKAKEGDKTDPWTGIAKYALKAEEDLRKIKDLNLIVVRPVYVYGPGDITSLSMFLTSPFCLALATIIFHTHFLQNIYVLPAPRIICGAVYKSLGEKMKFLWDEKLKLNTVHVRDVAKALWHLSQKGTVGNIYNLADKAETGKITNNKNVWRGGRGWDEMGWGGIDHSRACDRNTKGGNAG